MKPPVSGRYQSKFQAGAVCSALPVGLSVLASVYFTSAPNRIRFDAAVDATDAT
jgi:hypothetical protein